MLSALVEKGTNGAKLKAAAALCFISVLGSFTSERALHAPFQAPLAAARVHEQMVALVEQGTSDQVVEAADTLGELAGSYDPAIAKATIDAGAIPVLSTLVEKGIDEQRRTAVMALWDISVRHDARCDLLVAARVHEQMAVLAEKGTPDEKKTAASVLWHLAWRQRSTPPQLDEATSDEKAGDDATVIQVELKETFRDAEVPVDDAGMRDEAKEVGAAIDITRSPSYRH